MSEQAAVRLLVWRLEDQVRGLLAAPEARARMLDAIAESLRWRAELERKRGAKGGA